MTKPTPESDDELPGMWEHADFIGGDPDERSYAERERTTPEITEAMIERGARAIAIAYHVQEYEPPQLHQVTAHDQPCTACYGDARACILAALYDEAQAPAQSAELG